MTTWNYRVMRRMYDDEVVVTLIEVYYDENDVIIAWSSAQPAAGETIEELGADMAAMMLALNLPVVEFTDLLGIAGGGHE